MKKSILWLTLIISAYCCPFRAVQAQANSLKIASLDYYAVNDMLTDIVLAEPANAALKDAYEARKNQQRTQGAELMKKMLSSANQGEITVPIGGISGDMKGFEVDRKVSELVKAKCSSMLEELFGQTYDVVVDGNREILYSKNAIPDLTQQFKQDLLSKKRP